MGDNREILKAQIRGELCALLERTAADEANASHEIANTTAALARIFLHPRQGAESPPFSPARYRLPDERVGITGTLEILPDRESGQGAKYHVTVGYYPDGTLGEIFVKQELEGETAGALLDVVATAVSIGLQYGIPWEVFEQKFKHHRFRPNGITRDEDRDMAIVSSIIDYLAKWVGKRVAFRPPGDRSENGNESGETLERVKEVDTGA